MGQNVTVSQQELESIRPTLKAPKKTPPATAPPAKKAKPSSAAEVPKEIKQSEPETPTVTAADCVFDVTAANLQSVVFDSPVPVLIDVYVLIVPGIVP